MFPGDESFLLCHFAGEDELPSSSSQTRTTSRMTRAPWLCTPPAPTQKLSFGSTSGWEALGMCFSQGLQGVLQVTPAWPREKHHSSLLCQRLPDLISGRPQSPQLCSSLGHRCSRRPAVSRAHTGPPARLFSLQQPPQLPNQVLSPASFSQSPEISASPGAVVTKQPSAVTLGLPIGRRGGTLTIEGSPSLLP